MRLDARIAVALLSLVSACGRPEAAPTAPASPTVVASAPGAPVSAAASAASASVVASASVAASALLAPRAAEPAVVELRKPMLNRTLSIMASGGVVQVIESDFAGVERAEGRVAPAAVEALHTTLREARFCELASKQGERHPGDTFIEARFPDVACTVELSDARWQKVPAAKRVIDAVGRIEAEALPKKR